MAASEVPVAEQVWLMRYADDFEEYIGLAQTELFNETNLEVFEKKIKKLSPKEKEILEYSLALNYALTNGRRMDNFMKMYRQYVIKNPNEYYDSYFCQYFMRIFDVNMNVSENLSRKVFGKSNEEILKMIFYKSAMPNACLSYGFKLNAEERKAIEDTFLFSSRLSLLPISNTNDYFAQYPVKEEKTARDRQLKLIETASKKSQECGVDVNFIMRMAPDPNGSGGRYADVNPKTKPGILLFDVYSEMNDEVYYNAMFTLHHEFGHIKFYQELDEMDIEVQERIAIEKAVMAANRAFYMKYHDYFLLEQKANEHAIESFSDEHQTQPYAAELIRKETKKLQTVQSRDSAFLAALYAEFEKIGGVSIGTQSTPKMV